MNAIPEHVPCWLERVKSWFRVERDGSRRDARVDTMRGVFLALMIVDHLGGFWSKYLTWQPLGLISAAEGFVFLSGCVFAHVQGRKGTDLSGLRSRSWARAWQVYVWFLGVMAVFLLMPSLGWWLHDGLAGYGWQMPLPQGWWVLTGQDPNWQKLVGPLLLLKPNNILPLYVILILVAPFLLRAMQSRGGMIAVLCGSTALWWIGLHVDLQRHFGNWLLHYRFDKTSFPILSWQIYFVLGLACGVRWGRGIIPTWMRSPWVIGLVFAFALYLFLQRHAMIRGNYNIGWQAWPWNGAEQAPENPFRWLGQFLGHYLGQLGDFLGSWIWNNDHRRHAHPIRIANALALALLIKLAWERCRTEFGIGWLALMGRHSLAVYAIQEVVLFLVSAWKADFAAIPAWGQLPILVVVMAMYVGFAAIMEWRKKGRQQRALTARAG